MTAKAKIQDISSFAMPSLEEIRRRQEEKRAWTRTQLLRPEVLRDADPEVPRL